LKRKLQSELTDSATVAATISATFALCIRPITKCSRPTLTRCSCQLCL